MSLQVLAKFATCLSICLFALAQAATGSTPSIALDGNGYAVVSWRGVDGLIYANVFNLTAQTWATTSVINTKESYFPLVASSNHQAALSWAGVRNTIYTSTCQNIESPSWTLPQQLQQGYGYFRQMEMDDAGNSIIIYQDFNFSNIHASTLENLAMNQWSSPVLVSTTTGAMLPSISLAAGPYASVLWSQLFPSYPAPLFINQLTSYNLNQWSADNPVPAGEINPLAPLNPFVLVNEMNQCVILWQDNAAAWLFANTFVGTWNVNQQISTQQMTTTVSGGPFVDMAWDSTQTSGMAVWLGIDNQIHSNTLTDTNTNSWGADIQISLTPAANYFSPQIGNLGANQFVAMWQDLASLYIYAALFNGTSWGVPVAVSIAPGYYPQLGTDQAVNAFILWTDFDEQLYYTTLENFSTHTWNSPLPIP